MAYDERVPHALKREQQWFGSIISRPIDDDSKINPVSPSGRPIELEAADHIAPSPTLRPEQRIQIYNQQYWWRLLNTMHESFPILTRLFSYYDFNKAIGIPYISKYYPRHWSLSFLGDRLLQWIDENYHADDKELVREAAKVDWAFSDSFIAGTVPPLSQDHFASENDNGEVYAKKLYLQPYIHLLEMDYDLFRFRLDFLKHDPEYWLNNPFPELDKSRRFYFVLYRTHTNDIAWKDASECEFRLLEHFKAGSSIDQICDWLESQNEEIGNEATENMQSWFKEWSMRGWLSSEVALHKECSACS